MVVVDCRGASVQINNIHFEYCKKVSNTWKKFKIIKVSRSRSRRWHNLLLP